MTGVQTCALPILLFTAFIALGAGQEITTGQFFQIPISIITGLLLGIAIGWLLSVYFKRFHLRDSIKVIIMMSFAFLFLGAEQKLQGIIPLSGLLAVMAMGATILYTYPVLAKRISSKFSKLWIAAEILLFVLVGATVDIKYAIAAGVTSVIVIIVSLLFRMNGVFVSLIKTKLNTKERLFCMIAYTPKATVQAAIGSLPLAMGLACGKSVLTVAVLAILITAPLGAFAIDKTYKRLLENPSDIKEETIPDEAM